MSDALAAARFCTAVRDAAPSMVTGDATPEVLEALAVAPAVCQLPTLTWTVPSVRSLTETAEG